MAECLISCAACLVGANLRYTAKLPCKRVASTGRPSGRHTPPSRSAPSTK